MQIRLSRTALFLISLLTIYFGLMISLDFSWSVIFVFTTTLILFLQGIFFTIAMFYTWKDPQTPARVSPPHKKMNPKNSFSLIIPVRHEEKVIKHTLEAFSRIKYPQNFFEVLVVARIDDTGTIEKVNEVLNKIKNENFKLITFDGYPINKPKALNIALKKARGNFVAIFDAEDEPNPELLAVVDTFLQKNPQTAVVQGGVQLINVNSRWFSPIACLEYYFWFKSVLPLFSFLGSTPLGGNTVFFLKEALKRIGGWDEKCLTEDAEIGLRITAAGYKTSMIYDESLATLEETPPDTTSFVKQRTRWIQGYLQTISRGYWARQKSFRKELISFYLLVQPVIHQLLILLLVLGPILSVFMEVPLILSLISFIPLYFLALQWGALLIGLAHLRKNYQIKFSPFLYLKLLICYFPYQFVIGYSFLRAVKRTLAKEVAWEKTLHTNQHRDLIFNLNVNT